MSNPVVVDEQMLLSAVRYALGRMTGIVWATAKSVREAWPDLTLSARAVIARDIHRALNDATSRGALVGHAVDHKVWVSLHADIVTGALTSPPDAASEVSSGPEEGYPSEAELMRLAAFHGTARELVEYTQSLWRNGAGYKLERVTNSLGREDVVATFVTGGWSGCEEVIGVFGSTLARMYASEWRRGGLHSFTFPASVYDSTEPWDWALPSGGPVPGAGPYKEVRDRLAALEASCASCDTLRQ